jgi:hypothetical protein
MDAESASLALRGGGHRVRCVQRGVPGPGAERARGIVLPTDAARHMRMYARARGVADALAFAQQGSLTGCRRRVSIAGSVHGVCVHWVADSGRLPFWSDRAR